MEKEEIINKELAEIKMNEIPTEKDKCKECGLRWCHKSTCSMGQEKEEFKFIKKKYKDMGKSNHTFNLSEKKLKNFVKLDSCHIENGMKGIEVVPSEDVKTFIKKLKEVLKKHCYYLRHDKKLKILVGKECSCVLDLFKEINSLAGKELVE